MDADAADGDAVRRLTWSPSAHRSGWEWLALIGVYTEQAVPNDAIVPIMYLPRIIPFCPGGPRQPRLAT